MYGKTYSYNVYDNGELILTNVTTAEIKEALGFAPPSIPQYVGTGHRFKGRYTFKWGKPVETVDQTLLEFKKEWEEAIAPFKNVVWVKEGGRKLTIGGKK